MDNLKTYYMNNLIGDFEETFLTNKDSFKLLAKRFETAKKTGTLEELFGKEQAKDIFKFGRIMNVLGKSAQGGDLVAANIAANPFQNIGRIGRFFLIGKVLSNEAMYKSFAAKYGKEAAKAKTPQGKMQVFLDIMNQTVQSFAKQSAVRGAVGGASTAKEESLNLVNNLQDAVNEPSRTSVPEVAMPVSIDDMQITQLINPEVIRQQMNLRERAKSNPYIASTLLGGLGNADLL